MDFVKPRRRKSSAKWIVAAACWTLGIVLFLLGTEGLSRTSETALVQGSWGLIPFLAAGGGAFIGRRGAGWAILFASIFLTGTAIGLGLFFATIWGAL
jgi:hypothetical protein